MRFAPGAQFSVLFAQQKDSFIVSHPDRYRLELPADGTGVKW